jgi:hypothetical protein
MKKVIFSLAVALLSVTGANAQKQEGGEHNLEVQFAPLGGSPISVNGIRYRMFLSESGALRVNLLMNGDKTQTVRSQQTKTQGSDGKTVVIPELYDTESNRSIGIGVGYEMHFAGTDRLSPYAGAQLFFLTGKSTLTREYHNANNADDTTKPEKFTTWEMERVQGTSTFGLGLVLGTDFYFADHFYLGAELGLGFQSTKYKDSETTASSPDAWKYSAEAQGDEDFSDQAVWNDDNTAIEYNTIIGDGSGNYKESGWGVTFQPTLRLGWLFN